MSPFERNVGKAMQFNQLVVGRSLELVPCDSSSGVHLRLRRRMNALADTRIDLAASRVVESLEARVLMSTTDPVAAPLAGPTLNAADFPAAAATVSSSLSI